jgi:nitroreductase
MEIKNPIETMKKRYSCRTYKKENPDRELLDKLKNGIQGLPPSVFGNQFRFTVLDAKSAGMDGFSGTYGFIKNAPLFLAGVGSPGIGAGEDYGYVMEHLILIAAELGLGTCWLGGTINRSRLKRVLGAADGESVPAVSPIGLPAEKSLRARIISSAAGSRRRKPFPELFYREEDGKTVSIDESGAGQYREALESVRTAPSAMNTQNWRLVRFPKGVRFYLSGKAEEGFNYGRLNIGIAMCHFELAAEYAGITGHWIKESYVPENEWMYTVSWISGK